MSYKSEPLDTIFSRAGHRVDSADELETRLDCIQKKALEGNSCSVTDRKETCLAIGSMAGMALLSGTDREETCWIGAFDEAQVKRILNSSSR